MRTLALLSLSLAVALGRPPFAPGVSQDPVLEEEHQTPLLRDLPGRDVNEKPGVETQPEPEGHPDFEVESKVDKDVKSTITELQDAEEEVHVQMNLEAETEAGKEFNEREPVERSEPMVEAMSQLLQGEALLSPMVGMEPFEAPALEATRGWGCPGVLFEGKCYQFFGGPLKAADAEFFCQEQFTGGHLASITSQHIHRELMSMMLSQYGAHVRTWVGGLRYLETGRFVWLDGAHWGYADWLPGEPNNTSDVEDCIEVLPYGNGKGQFNDFTCWEPQAFICSYPYQ